MAGITFDNVSLTYPGADSPTVKSLDLEIGDGEFLVLVGPSGCGKSTTLRMLAGLEDVTEGSIRIGKRDVTHLPPKDRDISMVFQNYALYPHMTVAQNMGFALKIAKMGKAEIDKRVNEAARVLGLEEYLARKPKALSGGQRQRVAMGRAIVREPAVFLMDEPLSNLDAKLRVQTRAEIASLQRRLGTTTVYVTHDQVEAMTMGDRVAVLKDGVLQQCDVPRVMYDRPANRFVAGFIGSPAMNLISLPLSDEGIHFGGSLIAVSPQARAAAGGNTVTLGIRPEHLDFHARHSVKGLPVTFFTVEELGSEGFAYGHLDLGDGRQEPMTVRTFGREAGLRDQTVRVIPRANEVHLFSDVTGQRLPG